MTFLTCDAFALKSTRFIDISFLVSLLQGRDDIQRWKNVVLFALCKTSLCRIGKIVILSRRKWPARANGQRIKIHLFSHNLPLSHSEAQAYVFTSDRPFYFEPIKRALLRRRAGEDMRCFWDLTGNLALRISSTNEIRFALWRISLAKARLTHVQRCQSGYAGNRQHCGGSKHTSKNRVYRV